MRSLALFRNSSQAIILLTQIRVVLSIRLKNLAYRTSNPRILKYSHLLKNLESAQSMLGMVTNLFNLDWKVASSIIWVRKWPCLLMELAEIANKEVSRSNHNLLKEEIFMK